MYGRAIAAPARRSVATRPIIIIALLLGSLTLASEQRASAQGDPSPAISGTVTSADGESMPDVHVHAYRHLSGPWWLSVASVPLDDQGNYVLALDPGTYKVGFKDYQAVYAEEMWDNVSGEIKDGQDVSVFSAGVKNIDAVLERIPVYDPLPAEPEPVSTPPTNDARPSIQGRVVVGEMLTSTDGRWSPAPAFVTRQWLRNGRSIPGATSGEYRVTQGDVRGKLSVQITAYAPRGASSVVVSDSSEPARWTSKIAVRSRSGKKKASIEIRVTSPYGRTTGRVLVKQGGTLVKVVRLKNGLATVTLRKLKKKQRLSFVYSGSAATYPATVTKIVKTK